MDKKELMALLGKLTEDDVISVKQKDQKERTKITLVIKKRKERIVIEPKKPIAPACNQLAEITALGLV